MDRRVGLALGLVLTMAVALVAWLAWRPSERAVLERARPSAEPPAASDASALAGARAADAGSPAAEDARDALAERSSARASLVGRVLVPAGAPDDPSLAVIALFARDAAALPEALDPLASEREQSELPGGVRRERAAVEADGAFALARPADATHARLALDGRFLRLEQPLELALPVAEEPVLEPVLGAWLVGRVQPPAGGEELASEAVGAELGLVPTSDEDGAAPFSALFRLGRSASARLDEELRFELRAVPARSELLLTLDPRAWPPLAETLPALAAGERRELVLRPKRGARVEGRVEDERGAPLADVRVSVERRGFSLPGAAERKAQTDADGRFRLLGLRAGRATLVATRDDRPRAHSEELELVEGGTLRGLVLVSPAGARLAGHVRWPDGTPAAGAQLLSRALAGGATRAARADEEGAFELVGLDAGAQDVDAWHAPREPRPSESAPESEASAEPARAGTEPEGDEAPAGARAERAPSGPGDEAWWARAEAVDPQAGRALELELAAPLELHGRVVDERGLPVASFLVVARSTSSRPRQQRVEDESGAFRLGGLRPGRWSVRARHVSGSAEGPERELELPGEAAALELVLPRTVRVAGVVVDPLGAPVAEAEVSAEGEERSSTTTTDANGRFALEKLSAQGTSLVARAEGWAASEPAALALAPGEAHEELVLALRRGGAVAGLVLTRTGEPDAGAQVSAFGLDLGRRGARPRSARADDAGRFLLQGLEPGPWRVAVMPQIGGMLQRMSEEEPDPVSFLNEMRMRAVDVVEGETVEIVLGQPPEAPVALSGVVLEAGRAVVGASVLALREREALGSGMRAATTKQDGSFALELPAPGPVVLLVEQRLGGGGAVFPLDVPAVERHEVELVLPGGRIEGRVLDGQGRPAPGVRVRLESEGGGPSELFARLGDDQSTEPDGSFAFSRLRGGRFTLRADGEERGSAFLGGLVLEEGRALERELQLEPTGVLRGLVRGADGKPVAGAAVFARDETGHVQRGFTRVVSDASGRFAYEGLPAGRWSASATRGALASAESALREVGPGSAAEVELVLAPATELVVTLEGDAGEVLRAHVSVLDEAGHEHAGLGSLEAMQHALSEGFDTRVQRVGPLAPGRYTVSAVGPDGVLRKKPVTLAGQPERKLVLRLE